MSKRRILLVMAIVLFIICSLYVVLAIFIALKAEKRTATKADAILVLGARSYIGGNYNPCLKARVDHSVNLYKHGTAKKIIMSGGNDKEDGVNEAETMQKIAIEEGIPASAILLEKKATSTYENFVLSQEIIKRNHFESVVIVTEPFHMARAEAVAAKRGYTYTVSPVVESPCWKPNKYLSKYFLKEPFAIIMYKLQGKL